MYFFYILYSQKLDRYYTGHCAHPLQERIRKHLSSHKGFTAKAKDWKIVNAKSVREGVEQFARKNTVDMIAVCTHARKGLQRLFSPSIAERLANHCELPLWSIRL